mmetsp:Transcript_47316/g.92298  ORF Transcript_47316/g.92298 Transcript_47316/m.92298 type:complete len:106 (+) Transcript_47316:360-677(+)
MSGDRARRQGGEKGPDGPQLRSAGVAPRRPGRDGGREQLVRRADLVVPPSAPPAARTHVLPSWAVVCRGGVILDAVGGILSVAQLVADSASTGRFDGITDGDRFV